MRNIAINHWRLYAHYLWNTTEKFQASIVAQPAFQTTAKKNPEKPLRLVV